MSTFYDLCSDIWGGSPATVAMKHGVERGEINGDEDESIGELNDDGFINDLVDDGLATSSSPATKPSMTENMTQFLKNRRNKVIQKKSPIDQQLLAISKEELAFKKEMVEYTRKQDEDLKKSMRGMQTSVTSFTNSMTETFQFVARILAPQTQPQQQTIQSPPFPQYQQRPFLSRQSFQSAPTLPMKRKDPQDNLCSPENR